jgi:Flp pilus assembly pilin Flp
MEWILEFHWDESGASAVEYALLLVGIALTVAGSVAIFGSAINGLFVSAAALFLE